jgi:flagellar biosynthesis protein FlhA
MPSQSRSGLRDTMSRALGLLFPILIVGAVLVMVVPLPPVLMDLLLAANLTLSVVILLTTIHVASPLEFSVFPALLLGTTLVRLVLNVASTRLILTNGATDGTTAAGEVVEAFGDFVAAGSPTIGLIIFIILVTIQFVVITKGATRIGEVAARFALDGMPGRQMAVDADLASGLITKEEARHLRRQIARQADFYGAMDGASKFVRGDAVASLVITAINIIGGLYVGLINEGMSLSQAVAVFTTLTIGDGLVAQIPAFLIAIAAGLLVTRSSAEANLPCDVVAQTFRHPVALCIAAAFVTVLAFSGLPMVPLLTLGAACAAVAWALQSRRSHEATSSPATAVPAPGAKQAPAADSKQHLRVESLELELGVGLIRLTDAAAGGDLVEHITQLRERIAQELGFIVPKVRVTDNLRLDPRQFQVKLRGIPVAWGDAYADALLAVDYDGVEEPVPGIETREPASGRPARWIEADSRDAAVGAGYQILQPQAFLIHHLGEVVRSHAAELLTRQQVHGLLAELRNRSPQLVDELHASGIRTATVQQVLCHLLRERVSIRDLEVILEALGSCGPHTRNAAVLTECVRVALARTICQQVRSHDRVLHAVGIEPDLEERLHSEIEFTDADVSVATPAPVRDALCTELGRRVQRLSQAGHAEVVVCRPEIRAGLRLITARACPRLHVLSHNDVTTDTETVFHGFVALPEERRSAAAAESGPPVRAVRALTPGRVRKEAAA